MERWRSSTRRSRSRTARPRNELSGIASLSALTGTLNKYARDKGLLKEIAQALTAQTSVPAEVF